MVASELGDLKPSGGKVCSSEVAWYAKIFQQIQNLSCTTRLPTSAVVARLAGALVVVAAAVAGLALEVAGKLAHVAASVVTRVAVADVLVIALKMTRNITR